MKVIVLIKYIRYVYAQTGTEIADQYVGADDIIHMINPLDEMALEGALSIRDRNSDTRVQALTLGDRYAANGLKRALALGADEALHIEYDDPGNLDSWYRAAALTRILQSLDFDLILCGEGSIDHNAGLVGPFVAEGLGIPHITRVIRIDLSRERRTVRVERAVERGDREILECEMPALLTIRKGMTLPRYPTLPGLLRAGRKPIRTLKLKDLDWGVTAGMAPLNRTEVIGLSSPKPKKRKKSANGSRLAAADRLKALMKRCPSEENQGGNILEGSSEEMLPRVMEILRDNGIISD